MAMIRGVAVGLVVWVGFSCGGGALPECTRDTDCKGTRVCSGGACMDPGGGVGGGSGGSGGSGGGTAQPKQCLGGRDSDCPVGFWCEARLCTATTKSKVAAQCSVNADCAGNGCLYRNSTDVFGYCSKVCQSFGECPAFWDCKAIANASGNYCVQ